MAVSESNMAEFRMAAIIKLSQNEWVKFFFVQNGWIHDGRDQDGCHYQVESEWMSLSQIELVWVTDLYKMAESKMEKFKMAAIIKLSQNEWVKFFLCKMAESRMAGSKIAAIIKLSQNEWVKFFCANSGN